MDIKKMFEHLLTCQSISLTYETSTMKPIKVPLKYGCLSDVSNLLLLQRFEGRRKKFS